MVTTLKFKDTGETIQNITNIRYKNTFENKSTLAEFKTPDYTLKDKLNNNRIIEIYKDNNIDFIGKVKNIESDSQLTVTLEEQYTELLDFDTHGKIFYERDSGEAIQELISKDIESKGIEIINDGSSLTDVTGTPPIFELADFVELKPEKLGTNLIFCGFPKDTTSQTNYTVTIDNINTKGDIFTYFDLNLITNNKSGSFTIKVQYIDKNNKNYLWDLGEIDGINEYKLARDKAKPQRTKGDLDPSLNTNTNKMRLIITVKGKLIEDRAIAIDGIKSKSVDIINRENTFNNVTIPNSGRNIIRKFTNTVSEAVYKILEEENKKIIIDENNNLTVKQKGETSSNLIIDDNTPILEFDTEQDTNNIYNRIIVEGDGDVYAEQESKQSIDYFGFTNTKKIRDTSIKTKKNALEKASKQLEKYSFKDVKIFVETPPLKVAQNTKTGDEIQINLNGINDTFIVKEIEKQNNGKIKFTIDAESINT